MKSKAFNNFVICTSLILLLIMTLLIILIDPCFHYHSPIKSFCYPLFEERYQNDGIVRRFDYNGIITGASMTENFRTSECDTLFGGDFIKVPYSGGYLKEINDNLSKSFDNHKVKNVLRSLDTAWGEYLLVDKDKCNENYVYPLYLYDNDYINDVSYVLNKEFLLYSIKILCGINDGYVYNFDDYTNWSQRMVYGKDEVLNNYERLDHSNMPVDLSEEEVFMVQKNLEYNMIQLIQQNPETNFYVFIPPYSIVYWDSVRKSGELSKMLSIEKISIEMLLDYENVYLFSFSDAFEWVCNLDNYCDKVHYGEWINSSILSCISKNEHRLSRDNYQDYLRKIHHFYNTYHFTYEIGE